MQTQATPDQYRREPDGWRISHRQVIRPFDLAPLPPSTEPVHLHDDELTGAAHGTPTTANRPNQVRQVLRLIMGAAVR